MCTVEEGTNEVEYLPTDRQIAHPLASAAARSLEESLRWSGSLGIRRELIVPFLAYRMQEKIYGDPHPATVPNSAEL